MLATSSPSSNNISYIPLHRKFKQEAPQELSFCERQAGHLDKTCMWGGRWAAPYAGGTRYDRFREEEPG